MSDELWRLTRTQHGVLARSQLLAAGLTSKAINHRVGSGRLHRLWHGVYAIGRAEVSERGRWMAAVLSCGSEALLSHRSAAALWGLFRGSVWLEVVVPRATYRRRAGIRVHRRLEMSATERRHVDGIPVTDLVTTLVDIASCATEGQLERAVNEADRLDLIDPETLRAALDGMSRRPGLARLRTLLDRQTLVDTGLERRFLSLARAAGLPEPETQAQVNGYRVDFYWPQLKLVVEADGLRYHRTAGQQATDRRRDQVHTAAGLTTLRYAESQIRYEPGRVKVTLATVAARLFGD